MGKNTPLPQTLEQVLGVKDNTWEKWLSDNYRDVASNQIKREIL